MICKPVQLPDYGDFIPLFTSLSYMSQMILQKWAAEQSRLYCFTIWRRDKQFYHLGTWTHYDLFFSSVLPSSQVLSIHAYLLLPEVLRKFIFPIVYSWIRSWGNGTGWELSYGMNGVYTFRTVKDTKDRKMRGCSKTEEYGYLRDRTSKCIMCSG